MTEETGLSVALTGVAGATEYDCPKVQMAVLFMEAAVQSGQIRPSSEHDDYAWVQRSKLPEHGSLEIAASRKSPKGWLVAA